MILTAGFFITALIYASVGFAGGSTYLALLVVFGAPLAVIAPLALICNSIVSGVGSVRFMRAGLLNLRLLIPHAAFAMPCAYLGGRMEIEKETLQLLIAFSLLLASLHLIFMRASKMEEMNYKIPPLWLAGAAGSSLGLLSGLIGIGGGIFLAPFLYAIKAANPREIAATCCQFIFLNSLAGLLGQTHKLTSLNFLYHYWMLPLAVLIGGAIGGTFSLRLLSLRHITLTTGALLFVIAVRKLFDLSAV